MLSFSLRLRKPLAPLKNLALFRRVLLVLEVAVVIEQLYCNIDRPILQLQAVSGCSDPPTQQGSAIGQLSRAQVVWDHELPLLQVLAGTGVLG